MGIGKQFPSEMRAYADPVSGARIQQLTDYKCHSHALYFTNPGWYDGGRRLLFGSDRDNKYNLFSIELASGLITQLTDLDFPPPPRDTTLLMTAVNPVKDEAYFACGLDIMAIDLKTLQSRVIYRVPDGFDPEIINVTADGAHVCFPLSEDMSDRFPVDMQHGYIGFMEIWAAKPLSRIMRVSTDGRKAEVVWEENNWIGHVNTSPTQAHLLSYCHEGPWAKVDNRIWVLDMRTGKSWKVRPCAPGESVGHEYWMADGIHIGYHGHISAGSLYGAIRYDNTSPVEFSFPYPSTHFHSNTLDLIVGDGNSRSDPYIMLWRLRDGVFEGPRVLALHRSSFHFQELHPHPRFTADGKHVIYTANPQGYGQVYLADAPDFESLPKREEVK